MSFINIRRDNTDPFYRYKMPPIQSKVEGKGNGIKTAIVNLTEVSRSLNRPNQYIIKYFGFELGAQTSSNESTDRYLVNGVHEASKLQDLLDGFITKFVLCSSCLNPETEIIVKKDDTLQKDCKACGQITKIDPRLKLSSFIAKNPPESSKSKKSKKSATASANVVGAGVSISDIAAQQSQASSRDDAADEDDDDELTRKINAQAASLPQAQVADDEWAVDMSEEAVLARARELEAVTISSAFDQFGEWLLDFGDKSKLPSDVEIYKKASDLDIIENTETVQVLAQTLFDENVVDQIEAHAGLLSKLISSDDHQTAFLGGLERFLGLEKPDLIKTLPKILMTCYNEDVLDEESMKKWATKVSKKYVPKETSKKVRKAAKPFLVWLEQADSDSEDDE